MATTTADVTTAHASRYLQQLCKHWSHRFTVTFDPTAGTVALPDATLRMTADDAALHLALDSADANTLPRLKDVVVEHIRRFAFREELGFDWRDG